MSASVTHAEDYRFITKWGSYGSSSGQFIFPQDVAVDSSGNVYVADMFNNRIQKFSSSGEFINEWGSNGVLDGQFAYPEGIAVDSSGNVYVADTENNRIQKFDSNGIFQNVWGSIGTDDGQLFNPMDIAVDSSGNVYVADYLNNRIQKFDSNGIFTASWGSSGSLDGQFSYPRSIVIDSSGNVYVADTLNNRIQKFDSNGAFITKWGSSGTGDGQFNNPRGIAVDSSDNVYVSDWDNDRIQKFDNTGTFITKWGSSGTGDGQFSHPVGIAIDSSDYVYVIERDNSRVQKFSNLVFPVANFSTNVTEGYAPLSVQFTDLSENATGRTWDFGDGNNSTEQNPMYIFSAAGNYTVNLTVSNLNGTGSKLANITVSEPVGSYTIEKRVTDVAGNGSEANVTTAGDIISYQINVTNDGNVDLNNVIVDDFLINLSEPSESLNADEVLNTGEVWTYFGNYTVTQADLNNNGDGDGFINNTATVYCDELDPENDSANVPIEQKAEYSIYKSVIEVDNSGDCIVDSAGDIIRYRIVVKNEGNVDLTNISVNDTLTSLNGPTGDDVNPGILNPGEIWKFYGNYTITQADLNTNGGGDGDVDNTAIVNCSELPNKTASISQPISQEAYLRLYKSAIGVDNAGDNIANKAGDIIEYQIAVKNAGDVDLTGVIVSDPMISLVGPVESKSADGVLKVGELWTYTGNYTLTQEDLNTSGGGDDDIDNNATVSCNELPNETSSIEVPIVITRTVAETTDSESNNTTDDNTEDNDSGDSNDSGSSDSGSSGSSHRGGEGTGSANIISNISKDDEVNENSVKENDAEAKSGSSTKDVEETTESTVTDESQTENKEKSDTNKEESKKSPGFEMLFGIEACLLYLFVKGSKKDK